MNYALVSQHNILYDPEQEKDSLFKQDQNNSNIDSKKMNQIELLREKIRYMGRIAKVWDIKKNNHIEILKKSQN